MKLRAEAVNFYLKVALRTLSVLSQLSSQPFIQDGSLLLPFSGQRVAKLKDFVARMSMLTNLHDQEQPLLFFLVLLASLLDTFSAIEGSVLELTFEVVLSLLDLLALSSCRLNFSTQKLREFLFFYLDLVRSLPL